MSNWMKIMRGVAGCIAALPLALGVARAEDVGLVISAKGPVQVAGPAGKWTAASPFLGLPENGKVKLGGGASADLLLFKDGSRYRAVAPGTLSVSETAISGPGLSALPPLKLQQAKLLQSSRVSAGRPAAVTLRGDDDIELTSLSSTGTLDVRPTFKWSAVPGAKSYRVRVLDTEDNQVWVKDVEGTQIAYPDTAPAPAPGVDYVWQVWTMVGGTKRAGNGVFHVADAAKRQAVQTELAGLTDIPDPVMAEVMRAGVYQKYRLIDDAIAAYKRALEADPNSLSVLNRLVELTKLQYQWAAEAQYRRMAEKAEATAGE